MPQLNKDGLKVVFKPIRLPNGPVEQDDIEAVTVVVGVKEVEIAIHKARTALKMDPQVWTVTRVVECEVFGHE